MSDPMTIEEIEKYLDFPLLPYQRTALEQLLLDYPNILEMQHRINRMHTHLEAIKMMHEQLELPYGDTSGWSGTDTSRERAEAQDADGTYTDRQWEAISYLARHGTYGATWQELAQGLGIHHGQASGVLSGLHKTGHIARLSQRRNRCKIYVLPEHALGDTEPYTPHPSKDTSHDEIVSWFRALIASPEVNKVETAWATHFCNKIQALEYKETP